MLRALLIVLLSATASLAQDLETHGDWALVRTGNPAEPCVLRQILLTRETRTTLLESLLSPATEAGGAPVLTFVVPNGVSLASGIGYRHPEVETVQQLDWLYCDPDICLAARQLSPEEWSEIRRGAQMIAGYRPLPGAEAILIPVSLIGVTRGWAAVEACAG